MRRANVYDSSLHMFVQEPREADGNRLAFLRWLAEHGKLEHEVAGPASGYYVPGATQAAVEPSVVAA